jgi:hypothetical protein
MKLGYSLVDGRVRMPIASVAGIAVPAGDQPWVHEHPGGGFYAAMVETGFEPPKELIEQSLARAMARAKILACDLLKTRINEARREAESFLEQRELDLDGAKEESQAAEIPAPLALPLGNVLEGDFEAEDGVADEGEAAEDGEAAPAEAGPTDGDPGVECAGCGRLILEGDAWRIGGRMPPHCDRCAADAEEAGAEISRYVDEVGDEVAA